MVGLDPKGLFSVSVRCANSSKGFVKELLGSLRTGAASSYQYHHSLGSRGRASMGIPGWGMQLGGRISAVFPFWRGKLLTLFVRVNLWEGAPWRAPGWVEEVFVPFGVTPL